jgi:hypothetical protein
VCTCLFQTLWPSTWANAILLRAILHDPEIYENPEEYNPERFLVKDGKSVSGILEPMNTAFGFGRRICAGRFLSDGSLFSTIAHVLSVYDIKSVLDESGKEIKLEPDVTPGLVSYAPTSANNLMRNSILEYRYPVPFSCRIVPRSKAAENLIRESQFLD